MLSDNEKRDVIKLIEAGKSLPDGYRFKLFGDKREVELVWNGKTDEVTNVVLPFQVIDHIDEPRSEIDQTLKQELFDFSGKQLGDWTNKLIWGDNKLILSSLKNGPLREEIEKQGGIKLIYIDPPFDVGADFSLDIEIGEETLHREPSVLEELAYRDTWGKGSDSFIAMIYERLQLMRDLLAEDGSIFVHCDWRVSSYMRIILNDIFTESNFKNEIVWYYYNKMQGNVGRFASNHDTIFYYTKSESSPFLPLKEKRGETIKQIKRVWDKNTGKIVNAKNEAGKVIYIETDERTVDDVWRLSMLQPADRTQNVDYPTQKPESLLERIIQCCTKEGDVVADFFAGSGTTLAVAEKLGRKWIGSDLGKFSIHTIRKRMIDVQRGLKKSGNDYRAFEILNLGKYERQYFVDQNPDFSDEKKFNTVKKKESDFIDLILSAYKAERVTNIPNLHGRKNNRLVAIGPIDLPATRSAAEQIINICQEGFTKVDFLAFEFEMGLFPEIQDEAKSKGVDLVLKYIPRDVFDKRAIEKNQVVFHDVSFIEVKPHTNKNTLSIELLEFASFYSQESVAEVESLLKNGSSKVIVEGGQILKITKDENGITKREVLTKKWTDWIDYWSVDFNYESKKEIIRFQNNETGILRRNGLVITSLKMIGSLFVLKKIGC